MNIVQQQDLLKGLPDKALQQELLKPSGAAPSFLVLIELQRRKQMRDSFAAMQQGAPPDTSMAEEFARGVGGAQAGNYPEAVRGAMPQAPAGPSLMNMPPPSLPPQGVQAPPQQRFAVGGPIPIVRPANLTFNDPMGANAGADGNGVTRTIQGGPMGPQMMGGQAGGGLGGIANIVPVIGAIIDGSADGATGNASGTVGAGDTGVSGTGGVGGSASDTGVGGSAAAGVGGDDGGTYAEGGPVGGMGLKLIRQGLGFADGGEVEDELPPWATLRRSQQNRRVIRDGIEMPESYVRDTRTLKQRFDDAMKVPSKDIGVGIVRGLQSGVDAAVEALPDAYAKNKAMVETERQMYDKFWTPDPGKSLGQSISDKINDRSALGLPRNVSETGSTGPLPNLPDAVGLAAVPPEVGPRDFQPAVGGQGYSGPDPMLGVINAQEAQGVTQPPGVPVPPVGRQGAMVPPGVPSAGGGGGGGSRVVPGSGLNIGGEGLADYVRQVRALQPQDGFGDIDRRNQEDLDKLNSSIESEKGLALLQAGLGIAGGESPFFAVNVGRGAQAGVKQWNEATREIRRAERDLRNAQNQITIARANRDERQLEKGISLYARAQENIQRSLDRQNSAGIAAANRASAQALKERELEEITKDREERREQSRITEFGSLSQKYASLATQAETKLAALGANPLAEPGEAEAAKQAAAQARQQADYYSNLHRQAVIDREVKAGRMVRVNSPDEAKKLKPGTVFVTPDGQIRKID